MSRVRGKYISTQDELKQVLHYDPETGRWTWLISPRYHIFPGTSAGYANGHGYLDIQFRGVVYAAHRLAFLYVKGEWPKEDVDHADMDRANCRWINLREADKKENAWNVGPRKDSSSGLKGAYSAKRGKPWRSQIRLNEKFVHLGKFDTSEEAHAAYMAAATQHHGNFARGV